MNLTNSATFATAAPMPCCFASAWSAPPLFKTSGKSGSLKSAAAAPSRPSSLLARSATCGRTSKCWSSWRGGGRGRCRRKTPGRCQKKSGRSRTSSALRWRKRTWRRCLMRPSPWGCVTLTVERGGRGRSGAQQIRWRCSPSPGGRNMCASNKKEGAMIKTETAVFFEDWLGCKDYFYIHLDEHGFGVQNDFNSKELPELQSCCRFGIFVWPAKILFFF